MPDPNTNKERPLALVVDDEPDIRLLVGRVLESAGFRVREAEDGRAAVRAAAEVAPEAIVLDVAMPLMDGLQACRAIRAAPEGHAIPIVMLSARTDVADRIAGFEAGADDYLGKPFNPEELAVRVRAALRGRLLARGPAAAGGRDETRRKLEQALAGLEGLASSLQALHRDLSGLLRKKGEGEKPERAARRKAPSLERAPKKG